MEDVFHGHQAPQGHNTEALGFVEAHIVHPGRMYLPSTNPLAVALDVQH